MPEAQYTILIQIQVEHPALEQLPLDRLEQAAQVSLALTDTPPDSMLSLILSTDEELHRLNQRYRGLDAPTDVLAFPAQPLPSPIQEDSDYLGDVMISLPYVVRRATDEGHSPLDEVCLLIAHAILHLRGYDHATPESQKTMWAIQQRILQALEIALEVPDYIHE
ncbi:MAG: rRNA maturation RNase YbeY [Anaerolineae bacterium]|nr:rRNA maturation RNase YbeY [Anaerolineae bacterium]